MASLASLRDRVFPLPRFVSTPLLSKVPPEFYGGELSVRRQARSRRMLASFNLFLVALTLFLVPAFVPDEHHSAIMPFYVIWLLVSCGVYISSCDNPTGRIAERRVFSLGAAHLYDLPATLLSDPLFESYLHQVRLNVTPAHLETMEVLLADGFSGSVRELLDAAALLSSP